MEWMWRGEYLKDIVREYQRSQQQLKMEKFLPLMPDIKHRAFHELSKQEQASIEKRILSEFRRRTYKNVKEIKTEVCTQTIYEKENSFYVNTVRAERERERER